MNAYYVVLFADVQHFKYHSHYLHAHTRYSIRLIFNYTNDSLAVGRKHPSTIDRVCINWM